MQSFPVSAKLSDYSLLSFEDDLDKLVPSFGKIYARLLVTFSPAFLSIEE